MTEAALNKAVRPVIENLESRAYFSVSLNAYYFGDPTYASDEDEHGPASIKYTNASKWSNENGVVKDPKITMLFGRALGYGYPLTAKFTGPQGISMYQGRTQFTTSYDNPPDSIGWGFKGVVEGSSSEAKQFAIDYSDQYYLNMNALLVYGFSITGADNSCDANSSQPVGYASGVAQTRFDDFLPQQGGSDLSVPSRSWNNNSVSADGQKASFGNGMSFDALPYLQDLSSAYASVVGSS